MRAGLFVLVVDDDAVLAQVPGATGATEADVHACEGLELEDDCSTMWPM